MTGRGADTLLAVARAVLAGTVPVPPGQRTRSSAQLGRLAFEDVVEQLCAAHGAELSRAKMRSRLIVLDHVLAPELARRARAAWAGLSRACHRHAFELAPTDAEIATHLDHVDAVCRSRQGG